MDDSRVQRQEGGRFWAKTNPDGTPGVSVRDHCINVGCVAEALLAACPPQVREVFPTGCVALAALHDVGKISCGFQAKCQAWLVAEKLDQVAMRERWADPTQAESDHAKIGQYFLQQLLRSTRADLWAVAAGSHHGRIFGRTVSRLNTVDSRADWEEQARLTLTRELIQIFGELPGIAPAKDLWLLWCVAGLISVADWIASNEAYFPSDRGLPLEEARAAAAAALRQIPWVAATFQAGGFAELFGLSQPKPLQAHLHDKAERPGLFIVEGPMGCGKTEAALWAAHRLIESGANDGIYFALPTQVTSNRIHERIQPFLDHALADAGTLRLAHGASWLDDQQIIELRPTNARDADARENVRDGRSWFASPKHALLTRFGVGTIDQALQGVVAVKHFFVRRFGLAGKVVILDEVHSYDVYTGKLITCLIRELLALKCSVIVLSATLTRARRDELLAAAGVTGGSASNAYPLITSATQSGLAEETEVDEATTRSIRVQARPFDSTEILAECIDRAESGQHVLFLRNTVAEAQETYRTLEGSVREGRVITGLLHSRFPYFRRQEIEGFWLDRLGKNRASDGPGSILVATQVVEQSVDIDLDFIVSDLAPTDMLLQRMGRLWRHQREDRRAAEPEFWINVPTLTPGMTAREIEQALSKSGKVYAPYVLVRTAEVFANRPTINLPGEIRAVLEATYAERAATDEPAAWQELRAKIDESRAKHAALALAATKVLGQSPRDDAEEALTRLRGAPTGDLVLLHACEELSGDRWRITPLDGEPIEVSGYEWSMAAARTLHRNLVRAPLYTLPRQTSPRWLSLHTGKATWWATVRGDMRCIFPGAEDESKLAYLPSLGLNCPPDAQPQHRAWDDDDEFD